VRDRIQGLKEGGSSEGCRGEASKTHLDSTGGYDLLGALECLARARQMHCDAAERNAEVNTGSCALLTGGRVGRWW